MINQYHHTKIESIIEHSDNVRSFIFDEHLKSKPGQFAMVWLPGVDEKPISLSAPNRITVKKIGPFTEKLFEKAAGSYLDIRGPYGNGFPDVVLNTAIGGGVGIAPLAHFLGQNYPSVNRFVIAGKTESDLIFLDDLIQKYGTDNVTAATEDGSYGEKGLITDIDIPKSDHNYFICGPEIMMKKVAEKLVGDGAAPSRIYLSLERYMKCGGGVCRSCSVSGLSVCSDGPVFRYDKIKDLPHFKEGYHRTRTGELKKK
jgi:dihydroorotate dehydrogenase electron transfer subunit